MGGRFVEGYGPSPEKSSAAKNPVTWTIALLLFGLPMPNMTCRGGDRLQSWQKD